MLSTETNGPGYSTVGALLTMNYPMLWRNHLMDKQPGTVADQFGFQSNMRNKHIAIGTLIKHIVDHNITIHDRITFAELKNYVTYDNSEMGPADEKNGFDDCVTSLAIGVFGNYSEPPLAPLAANRPGPVWGQGGGVREVQEEFNQLVPR